MSDLLIQTLLCIPVLIFNGFVAIGLYKRSQIRREVKFLKQVRIKYPNSTITFTSIETSDSEAMERLRKQLEES